MIVLSENVWSFTGLTAQCSVFTGCTCSNAGFGAGIIVTSLLVELQLLPKHFTTLQTFGKPNFGSTCKRKPNFDQIFISQKNVFLDKIFKLPQ